MQNRTIFIICEIVPFTDLPGPIVSIEDSTTAVAGELFQLMCNVTTVDHLSPNATLSVTWSGGSVNTGGVMELNLMTISTTSIKALQFTQLNTSHGGNYSCTAVINVSSINITKTGSDTGDLIVQSKDTYLFE